jgi:phenolic acid decarboxylase
MITGALQWSIGRKHGVNLAWLAWLDLNFLDGALMVSMYSTNDIHSRGHIKLYLRAHFIQLMEQGKQWVMCFQLLWVCPSYDRMVFTTNCGVPNAVTHATHPNGLLSHVCSSYHPLQRHLIPQGYSLLPIPGFQRDIVFATPNSGSS